MNKYKFEYVGDDGVKVTTEIENDHESWCGVDGPMYNFFNFLKGIGYVFDINSELGVLDKNGNFSPCSEDLPISTISTIPNDDNCNYL